MSDATPPSSRSSRTARIAQFFGIGAPALTILGIALSQIGLPAMVGFRLFTLAILLGLVALVLGGIGLFVTRGGVGGRSQALMGIAGGALMLLVVFLGAGSGASAPPINDITTDLDDPPAFRAFADDHPNAGRDMSYPTDWPPIVREAYPDLQPIRIPIEADRAYSSAVAQADSMGWTLTHQDPQAREFEAYDETALFHFIDDISVRVRPDGPDASVIDVRSKSRDGRGDIGANARRIRAFSGALERAHP
jgi:uncharacterized protein (DUF1499 family)